MQSDPELTEMTESADKNISFIASLSLNTCDLLDMKFTLYNFY